MARGYQSSRAKTPPPPREWSARRRVPRTSRHSRVLIPSSTSRASMHIGEERGWGTWAARSRMIFRWPSTQWWREGHRFGPEFPSQDTQYCFCMHSQYGGWNSLHRLGAWFGQRRHRPDSISQQQNTLRKNSCWDFCRFSNNWSALRRYGVRPGTAVSRSDEVRPIRAVSCRKNIADASYCAVELVTGTS